MHKRGIVCFEIMMKHFCLVNVYGIRHTEAFELKAVCLFAHCHADILVILALIEMGIAHSNAMCFSRITQKAQVQDKTIITTKHPMGKMAEVLTKPELQFRSFSSPQTIH